MNEQPESLSLENAALVLKVSIPTIQSMIERGLIKAESRDGQTSINYDDLVAFMREDQRALMEDGQQSSDLGLLDDSD